MEEWPVIAIWYRGSAWIHAHNVSPEDLRKDRNVVAYLLQDPRDPLVWGQVYVESVIPPPVSPEKGLSRGVTEKVE